MTLQELINHNADLQQLINEGYEVEIFNIYLIIKHIPYVNDKKQVAYGTLISKSNLSGHTVKPMDHTVLWVGDYPYNSKGTRLNNLVNKEKREEIREGLVSTYLFSQKPKEGLYRDYHHKITQYIKILENEARVIDPEAKAITFHPIKLDEEESIFYYMDTASSRAGIVSINKKLKKDRMAIIGLGGTGSYILDLVAKTPIGEIHLFDGDEFYSHNAFRSPGAPSYDDLSKNMTKMEWFTKIYSCMRRKIIPHPYFIDEINITKLNSMNIVFICVDKGESREMIVNYLVENNICFIDVGIGILNENESLTGSVRITTGTPAFYDHTKARIPVGNDKDNEYSNNIQVADLNALNAALAVIKWKKMCGFYHGGLNEYNTVYGILTNTLTNDKNTNET